MTFLRLFLPSTENLVERIVAISSFSHNSSRNSPSKLFLIWQGQLKWLRAEREKRVIHFDWSLDQTCHCNCSITSKCDKQCSIKSNLFVDVICSTPKTTKFVDKSDVSQTNTENNQMATAEKTLKKSETNALIVNAVCLARTERQRCGHHQKQQQREKLSNVFNCSIKLLMCLRCASWVSVK